jgi:tetratricopeptide (TPR) repeat protein
MGEMMKVITSRALFLVISAVSLAGLFLSVYGVDNSITQAVRRGDHAYNQRFEIEADDAMTFLVAYKPSIEEAIIQYAMAVPNLASFSIQSQSYVYNRLAQLHYELAKILILQDEEKELIKDTLVAGKEYGFSSLALQPGFDRERFGETLGLVWDAAALVWTADCWGTWLSYNPIEGLINLPKIREMYKRALYVYELFWDGSAHIGLGALLATAPTMMGGDLDAAVTHFERALEIDPGYLPASAVYAESYGFTHSFGNRNGIRDRVLIETCLERVLNTPVGEERPFWNWEAKAEVQFLYEEIERFSR